MQFLIIIFLIWRVGLFFIAAIGERILSFSPRFPYAEIYLQSSGLPHWLWPFANFDGVHYLTIAEKGYSAQFTQVFFPLYPLLIGIINKILPFINPVIIGLFLSNILFLLSLVIFWKLLKLDYREKEIKWMMLFLILFPTSFFFGSLYTESLFMFLVLSSFYAARKKKWLLAGILGGLASATRLIGIFMLPALIWEYYGEIKNQKQKFKNMPILFPSPRGSPFGHPRGGFKALLIPSMYLVPVGLLVYMLYLQIAFGDALYFWHAQPVFGAERTGSGIILLPQVLWRYFKILTSVSFASEAFWIPMLELVSTIGAVAAIIAGYFKKIRLSYLLFSILAVVIPTLTGTFSSMPRYILAAFPIFMLLAMIKSRVIKSLLVISSTVLLGILAVLFTAGHWVG